MSIELVFIGKLLVSIFSTGLVYLLWINRQTVSKRMAGQEIRWLNGAFLAFRLIPFIVVYLLLNEQPRGDVPFFYEKASKALQGGLVYVDFWSFHAPVFAYILALPLIFWHSSKAIVLLMLLVEWLAVFLTYRFYQKKEANLDPINRRAALNTLLYWLLPAPLIICMLGGQEEIWLWLFGLVAIWTLRRPNQTDARSSFQIGLIMAMGLLCLKVTFAMILFPIFFLIRDKVRFVGAIALVGVPALLLLYSLMGMAFLMPMQHGDLPFSPNLSTVLRPFLGGVIANVPIKTLNFIGLAIAITAYVITGIRYRSLSLERAFPSLWVITFGLFMLLQASAMAYYVFIFLIAFVFELTNIHRKGEVAFLVVINWLVIVQPFVTVYTGQLLFNSMASLATPIHLLTYALEAATVCSVARMVWLAYQRLEKLIERDAPVSEASGEVALN